MSNSVQELETVDYHWMVLQDPPGPLDEDTISMASGPFKTKEEAIKYCKEVAPKGRKTVYYVKKSDVCNLNPHC